jgi:hypothetical protein
MKQFCLGIIVAVGLMLPAFALDGTPSSNNPGPLSKPAPLDLPADLLAQVNPGGTASVDPLIGTWKLNLEKSTSTGGPLPKSMILTFAREGQSIVGRNDTVDAKGQAFTLVTQQIYDGMPHPSTGVTAFDASAFARIGNTINIVRFKEGKIVAVAQAIIVPGKTYTITSESINDHSVFVWDRQ